MAQLPTVTITADQAQRCLAAWGSQANYKSWLIASVRAYVVEHERTLAMQEAQAAALARYDSADPLAGAT